ncbi:MAG TPA: hypothetical protein VE404_10790 [Verrucomicrobiae bacterium]|nr:hypothetical protein [Verrucomicrobiae bacterium]
MLHVASGESTIERLRHAAVRGYMVPWLDLLHEGPVPADVAPPALRELRARFIAGRGWGDEATVRAALERRDAALAAFREHDEIVLWFERGLVGQLQLAQVLDQLAGKPLGSLRVTRIETRDPVGRMPAESVRDAFERRVEITERGCALARNAWIAFRAPEPVAIEPAASAIEPELPHLAAALGRHLEEFPSVRDGLSRTERQILEAVRDGRAVLRDARVASHHEKEPHVFLGDTVFAGRVEVLGDGPDAALARLDGAPIRAPKPGEDGDVFWKGRVRLTDTGFSLLEGKKDWIKAHGIDRWLGGVCLVGRAIAWRFSEAKRQIQRTGVYE